MFVRRGNLVSSVPFGYLKILFSFLTGCLGTAGVSNDRKIKLTSRRTRADRIAAIFIRLAVTPFTSSSSEAKVTRNWTHSYACANVDRVSRVDFSWLLARSTLIFQPEPHHHIIFRSRRNLVRMIVQPTCVDLLSCLQFCVQCEGQSSRTNRMFSDMIGAWVNFWM